MLEYIVGGRLVGGGSERLLGLVGDLGVLPQPRPLTPLSSPYRGVTNR